MAELNKVKSVEEIAKEFSDLQLEEKRLQVELMRKNVADMHEAKELLLQKRKQIEFELRDFREREKARQDACNHKKGGKNLEGLAGRGDDSKYAIWVHQLPFGDFMVLCSRCQKIWMRGDKEYEQAISWPTDNSPSASSQFRIVQTAAAR